MNSSTTVSPKALNQTSHLATLDALRGITGLAVLWHHIVRLMHIHWDMPHAYLSVEFFFMLSGFVVARAYENKLNSGMRFAQFAVARFRRLYPMLFLSIVLSALTLAVHAYTSHDITAYQVVVATLCGLILMPTYVMVNVRPNSVYPLNDSLWSMFFILTASFVYASLTRWISNRRLVIVTVLFWIGMSCAAIHLNTFDAGWGTTNFLYGFARVFFPFAAGILLHRHAPATNLFGDRMTAFVCAAMLLAVYLPIFPNNAVYEIMIVTLVFPPLIYLGSACTNSVSVRNIGLRLGALSYPVYIMHHSIIRIVYNALQMLHIKIPEMVSGGLGFIASIAISYALMKIWDEPVRKWLADRRKQAVKPTSVVA